jgi:hypothetical protein
LEALTSSQNAPENVEFNYEKLPEEKPNEETASAGQAEPKTPAMPVGMAS